MVVGSSLQSMWALRRGIQHAVRRRCMSAQAGPRELYARLSARLQAAREAQALGPLTAAQKILYSHLSDPTQQIVPSETYLNLFPDRVALQDASAQTALLQFLNAGLPSTAVPTSIHCDHLIVGTEDGSDADLQKAIGTNQEVYNFLSSASRKYGIHFWPPGSGIIHQIVLENYATPGALMVGCDSHTPNAGGLGTVAIGVGGADAVDVMSDMSWELQAPRMVGVHLTGELSGWAAPKDVILKLTNLLGEAEQVGYLVEYFGPGVDTLSCTAMATICNMGAEAGATTSIFPYCDAQAKYLDATGRGDLRAAADQHRDTLLRADPSCSYDQVYEINLSELEPRANGPFSPRISTPISQIGKEADANGWPKTISASLIGSCTNSSYEDITKSVSIAEQAAKKGIKPKTPLFITPGSEQIFKTCERDGLLDVFTAAGASVLANACGPCIGQWDRSDVPKGEKNTIMTSFNRNFPARNDGNHNTHNFVASPEIVTAMAYAGTLDFDPATDTLHDADGNPFRFELPKGVALPEAGFASGRAELRVVASEPLAEEEIAVSPSSDRLQLLEPFPAWDGQDLTDLAVLVKVRGDCTTDHISAAGPWLKYKGHLQNISNNTLIGAVNDDSGERNEVQNRLTGDAGTIPQVASDYKAAGLGWVILGEDKYGEGSAREHAAMQPRYLGCRAVIVKSFARIHETNLKKQGILPLTFDDPADYHRIPSSARVAIAGLADGLSPAMKLTLRVTPEDGSAAFEVPLRHTMSTAQLGWFAAGSALNEIARQTQAR